MVISMAAVMAVAGVESTLIAGEAEKAAPDVSVLCLDATQAKGGGKVNTDRGNPAVFFPSALPENSKILWMLDTPLPPGLWQVDVEFYRGGETLAVNQMLSFEGAGAVSLGKIDLYYANAPKGSSTQNFGFYSVKPMTTLVLVKTSQRNQDTVAISSIKITPGDAGALEKRLFSFQLPVSGEQVSMPVPLPSGIYVISSAKPVALRWTLPDGRTFATPKSGETRVYLNQNANPAVISGGPVNNIMLAHYPAQDAADMTSAGNAPLATLTDPAKIEERTLTLVGYRGNEQPKLDILPCGKTVALVTSWDDGKLSDIELIECLKKYGVRGTIFMNRESKTIGMLRDFESKGMEIGSHGWHHPAFYNSSPKRCLDEAVGMRRFLEKELGHPVISFAYPFNYQAAYDADGDYVLRSLRQAGYWSGRATTTGNNRIDSIPEPLALRPNFHFKVGADRVKEKLNVMLKTPGSIVYLWGHSNELSGDGMKTLEAVLATVANRPELWYTTQGDLMVWKFMRENLRIEPVSSNTGDKSFTLKMPWLHPYLNHIPLSLKLPDGVTAVLWQGQQLPVVNRSIQLKW